MENVSQMIKKNNKWVTKTDTKTIFQLIETVALKVLYKTVLSTQHKS